MPIKKHSVLNILLKSGRKKKFQTFAKFYGQCTFSSAVGRKAPLASCRPVKVRHEMLRGLNEIHPVKNNSGRGAIFRGRLLVSSNGSTNASPFTQRFPLEIKRIIL